MTGVICFCIGEIVGEKFTFSLGYKKISLLKRNKNAVNVKMFYFLFFICLICLLPDIKMILYFIQNGFDLNRIYYSIAISSADAKSGILNVSFGSNMQQIIKTYIGYPLLYLLISISLLCFMKNREKKYILCMLFLTMIRFLADLKRTLLVMLILMFVFFFISAA